MAASRRSLIVTLTGPSGSGKTVLSQDLRERGFEPLISTTTRKPRVGEVDGVDYHFVSPEGFAKMARNNLLIEQVEYDGNGYGISRSEAERAFSQGKPAVLVAEPHGVQQIAQYCHALGWEVLRVFVSNPLDVLMERLLIRYHHDTAHLPPTDNINTATDDLKSRTAVYANRISKVAGFEQNHWVLPAFSGQAHYDLLIDKFDSSTRNHVINQVLALSSPSQPGPARPEEHSTPARHGEPSPTKSLETCSSGSRLFRRSKTPG